MYTTRTGTTRGARLRTALPALLLILCLVGGLLSSCADLTLPFRPETETTAATIPLHAIPLNITVSWTDWAAAARRWHQSGAT